MTTNERQLANLTAEHEKVAAILSDPENMTDLDRAELISDIYLSKHGSGKIEGIYSIDVSCRNCDFCKRMRSNAADDPRFPPFTGCRPGIL